MIYRSCRQRRHQRHTQRIAAADRLGVLDRLRLGPIDSTTLAHDCAISERGASLLLAALAGLGLVEAMGGRGYRALDQPIRLVELLSQFRQLEDAVRDGKTILAVDVPAQAGAFYPDVVPVLADIAAPQRSALPSTWPDPVCGCSTWAPVPRPGASPSPVATPPAASRLWTCRPS
jgi:hypothetical protein